MESEIRELVFAYVKTFAQSQGLRVVFPNKKPKTKLTKLHLKASLLNTTPDSHIVCNGTGIHQWILQLDVMERDGADSEGGESRANELVDKIVAAFKPFRNFVGVTHRYQVARPADPRPPIPSGGWYSIPVQIRLRTLTIGT